MIYDVIVVGSGPGGAVAAALLAKQGQAVLLVDRQSFPRDKVCGDGMPGGVIQMLHDPLGLDFSKTGLNFRHIGGVSIGAPSGQTLTIQEGEEKWLAIASPRYNFDDMLHQHALRCGARFETMQVDSPLIDRDHVAGVIERRGSQFVEHEARVVIAADGAASAIARGLRGRVSDPRETAIAIRAYGHLKKPMPSYIYFQYLSTLIPGYAWVFPVSEDVVNIGLGSFNQSVYKERGQNLRRLFDQFAHDIQDDFPMEIDASSIKAWSIPCWTSPQSRVIKGAYLIGDAGRFVDALTAGGIYPAMVTGMLAAQSATKVLQGTDRIQAAQEFDGACQAHIGKSLRRALLVQKYIASKPPIFTGIFSIAAHVAPIRERLVPALAGQHA